MVEVLFIVGTRPEIIKTATVCLQLEKMGVEFSILDTSQQVSQFMKDDFYKIFNLEKYVFKFANTNVWEVIKDTINLIQTEGIKKVVVQGDTNSALIGAISATQAGAELHHIEAGLRSNDYRMREEYNRIIIDRVADYLYAPTKDVYKSLMKETKKKGAKVIHTGNTVMDALWFMEPRIPLVPQPYSILLTLHRPENVDKEGKLRKLLQDIQQIANHFNKQVAFFIHPRTKSKMIEFDISLPSKIEELQSADYQVFLSYLQKCDFVITDSGGIQEECCYYKKPCLTLRKTTERPESVKCGINRVLGDDPSIGTLEHGIRFIKNFKPSGIDNPFYIVGTNCSELIAKTIRGGR